MIPLPLNVVLTVHLDAFGLASAGAVTVRNVDGECLAIETFALRPDSPLNRAADQLCRRARRILAELPEQLSLLS